MNAKQVRSGGLLVGLLLMGGATGLAMAGEEPPRKESEVRVFSGERVLFDGRSWLGVHISDVTAERARELKLAGEYGVVVEEVEPESPAAKAGMQASDVILSFADERVRSAEQLRRLVRETPAGRTVPVQVSRAGQTRSLQVTVAAQQAGMSAPAMRVLRAPPHPPMPPEAPMPPGMVWMETPEFDIEVLARGPQLGISGDELTPQLAEFFGVKAGKGVLVREVLVGTAADKGGLKAGDVIVKVDGEGVATVGELRRALRKKREGKQVSLTIVRNRAEQNLSVELDQPQTRGPQRVTQRIEWQVLPEELNRLTASLKTNADRWRQALQESLTEHRQEWDQAMREAQAELQKETRRLRIELQRAAGKMRI